ncbi:MAG TPA: HAD-IIIA family hydrolase [Gemmatimonadales bacterium]
MTGDAVPRPAVFLDRDGTLIDDTGFLDDPHLVRLIPGAASALRDLEHAGYLRIVITNQSGIGRGRVTLAAFAAVQQEMERQLAAEGVSLDATYWCPHAPEDGCLCRKPGTALYREAIASWNIAVDTSWCIGDQLRDIEPARELGCRSLLVRTGKGTEAVDRARDAGALVADDLAAGIGALSR